jgi:hypothetical protein
MFVLVQSPVESRAARARAATVSEALNKAIAGGLSGGAAQGINVVALMWLRTTMNVQMVNGSSMRDAFKALYAQVRQFHATYFNGKACVISSSDKCAIRAAFPVFIED